MITTRHIAAALLAAALGFAPAFAGAQGTNVAFGGLRADSSQPIEVTADQLTVSQTDSTAHFSGHVVAIQGEMRMSADDVTVEYDTTDQTQINRIHARGNVVLVSGPDAAKAAEAVYTIASGSVEMTGDVVLTQGANALSGQKLVIDLDTGTGHMTGRVRTILKTGGN